MLNHNSGSFPMMKYTSVLGVLFNYALNCVFYTEGPGCMPHRYLILNVSVLPISACAFCLYSWHSFPPIVSISRNNITIHQSIQPRNPGVIFNFSFSLIFHIQSIITSCWFYFQNIILIFLLFSTGTSRP